MEFRLLKASEIECRVGTVSKEGKGFSLLLYKDARVDMKILDEVFGWDGWKREHQLIDGKLFCTVSIWSEKRNEWISKQDVGTESYTEKEKGQASDAFKRACVNFGIGRELYTSPFIWIGNKKTYNTKYDKFKVKEVEYNENREISKLVIIDKDGEEAYFFNENKIYNNKTEKKETTAYTKKTTQNNFNLVSEEQLKNLYLLVKDVDINKANEILNKYNFKNPKDITKSKYNDIYNEIKELKK